MMPRLEAELSVVADDASAESGAAQHRGDLQRPVEPQPMRFLAAVISPTDSSERRDLPRGQAARLVLVDVDENRPIAPAEVLHRRAGPAPRRGDVKDEYAAGTQDRVDLAKEPRERLLADLGKEEVTEALAKRRDRDALRQLGVE